EGGHVTPAEMALYLVCGSRHRNVYSSMVNERLSKHLPKSGESLHASYCSVEALDDRGLQFSGLLLISEDDSAFTDIVSEQLQKLNLTVAPLIVQDTWEQGCLPGLLLFECREDPAEYASRLREKSCSIVGAHRMGFCRQRNSQMQFYVLVVVLTGGPQALSYVRECLTRLICADLRLERGLFARLSRPGLADNPPYVPTVDSRCLKTSFLLVRGSHSYADRVQSKFKTAFRMTSKTDKYFAILAILDKSSPAYRSDPERRALMDQLMSYKNCRVDEVFVCQLDCNSCMAPVTYAVPPVGITCSPYLMLVTDTWGPSKAALLEACRGQSYSCFFTAGPSRIAVMHFADAGDRHSTALAVIALGVQVYAAFINDWIVHVETVPHGPLRDTQFLQLVRPDLRSLVLHGPPPPSMRSPTSLLPTPPCQSSLPAPLQHSLKPDVAASASTADSAEAEVPSTSAEELEAEPADDSLTGWDTDLDAGSPMSIESDGEEVALEAAVGVGEAPEPGLVIGGGFPRGPRTPSESSADDQPLQLEVAADEAASSGPSPSPQPAPQPQQLDQAGGLLSNVCLRCSRSASPSRAATSSSCCWTSAAPTTRTGTTCCRQSATPASSGCCCSPRTPAATSAAASARSTPAVAVIAGCPRRRYIAAPSSTRRLAASVRCRCGPSPAFGRAGSGCASCGPASWPPCSSPWLAAADRSGPTAADIPC
ncbi:hypothetical protein BOX15_Mlig014912g1, partial [Macrostomum lignano]